ncbi:MAG: VOC family protein [Elusimicrobiota bacterium]
MKPIPEGYHTVTPNFTFKDSRKAIEFYKKALGAVELAVFPAPGGKGVMHAVLKIGNSIIMMGDENPEMNCRSAESLGASPISLYVYVENADAAFKKAVAAGAAATTPLQDAFWGDRFGVVKDPFGYSWNIATHTKDLTPEQLQKAAEEAMAHVAGRK